MVVVMNVLRVPEAAKPKMAEMFARAADHMKEIQGFVDFQFLNAVGEDKQVVYTKWETREAFEAWRKSDAFSRAHSSERTDGSPATGSAVEMYEVLHSS